MRLNGLWIAFSLLWALNVSAAAPLKPHGKPDQPIAGTFFDCFAVEPENLNPLTSSDIYSRNVQGQVMDTLMILDPDTYKPMPGLAERYEAAKDGMSYTFYIRKDAKFHDGTPITAHDVKFSFDAVLDPKFNAVTLRPYLENIGSAEVVDDYTVKFKVKTKYFNNFDVLASGILQIIPRSVYGDPSKKQSKILVGSGPYIFEKYDRGQSITLKRNPNWWGNNVPHLKGLHKMEKIVYRFIKEDVVRLEMLKKGQLDYLELSPEQFMLKTNEAPFGTKILKEKTKNGGPKGYSYVAWNLRNDLFKDKKVRRALAHLMNRDLMNQKFRYNMAVLATGPWYPQNPYASSKVKAIPFDPKAAQKLFAEAGWTDSDKDGVLDKEINGERRPFRFTLMFGNRDTEKYFTLYKEDLKKSGVDMELKVVEWNGFVKALDDRKFEAVSLAWGGGSVDVDPKQIWHSESDSNMGSNFVGYHNAEVDKLINQGRVELNEGKRKKLFQKVYEIIADEAPYAFMFADNFALYAHWDYVKMEKPTYKFGVGQDYWWMVKP